MRRPLIIIINSSTFGKHFSAHIRRLESFATVEHLTVPAGIGAADLAARIRHADGIIASVTPKFPRHTLEQCTRLVHLVRHGIGCDNVDLEAATDLGIGVSRVKGLVEREAVAEYAVGLLIAAARKIPQGRSAVQQDHWAGRSAFIGMELSGKTVGIIGLGNIGSRSAEILHKGFNARIIASDPYITNERFQQFNATPVSLPQLLKDSDAVLFHCPLTPETQRMLGPAEFALLKPGSILVNTCRGELVEEDALYDALLNGPLGAYATDVVEGEPIDSSHRLTQLDNTIITPHLGGYSWESLEGMGLTCVEDMEAVFVHRSPAGELANPAILEKQFRQWPLS